MPSKINEEEKTYLSASFVPTDKDVLVGRGKVCYQHAGNLRLNQIVKSWLPHYASQASTKKSKSNIIRSIVEQVRADSPDGGFVKKDGDSGVWYEVGSTMAREKVSQTFRDALEDQYKSSSASKTARRQKERKAPRPDPTAAAAAAAAIPSVVGIPQQTTTGSLKELVGASMFPAAPISTTAPSLAALASHPLALRAGLPGTGNAGGINSILRAQLASRLLANDNHMRTLALHRQRVQLSLQLLQQSAQME